MYIRRHRSRNTNLDEKGTVGLSFKNSIYAVKEVWKFNKAYILIISLVSLFSQTVSALNASYYMKYLVSSIEQGNPFNLIVLFVLIFFAVELLVSFLEWWIYCYYQDINWNKFKQYYNKKLFKNAGNAELACYENPEFYNKYTMALDNTSERLMQVCSSTIYIVFLTYKVIILVIAMFAHDKFVGLFLIFPIFGNFFFGTKLNNLIQKIYKENTKNSRIISYVTRTLHLNNFSKEMRITNIYELIQQKHRKAVEDSCDVNDKYSKKRCALFWSKNFFVYTLIFEGVVIYSSYRAMVSGTLTLAGLTVMTSIMVSLSNSLVGLFDSLLSIHNESLYIENARDFLAYKPKIPEDADGKPAPKKIDSIEFRNVSFGYKPNSLNIENVSFKIDRNKTVAFVGANGAGKTTVIKLLLRLYDPTSGEILLNGINIKEYNVKQYRKLFSAAFQDYKVVAMSVKDNIAMGADIENPDEKTADVLKKVKLYDKVKTLQKGIDTIMTKEFDDDGAVLSGGQYQKLAVARAIAQNRPVYVFDEPSSALDPIAEYELFDTIMKESKNKTMVFISHRLSSVKNADSIFMFEKGRLIEVGNHKALMKQNGKYADMYSHQAQNYLAKEAN